MEFVWRCVVTVEKQGSKWSLFEEAQLLFKSRAAHTSPTIQPVHTVLDFVTCSRHWRDWESVGWIYDIHLHYIKKKNLIGVREEKRSVAIWRWGGGDADWKVERKKVKKMSEWKKSSLKWNVCMAVKAHCKLVYLKQVQVTGTAGNLHSFWVQGQYTQTQALSYPTASRGKKSHC